MKHKKIMIQGVGSSVGKSIITAGLCRIFNDDGYKVAPFKSQNMALNSYVDIMGGEMGRAQVVQAECARTIPRTFMNPILLKPNADNNSQIIIEGKAWKNMDAESYFKNYEELRKIAKKNYDILANNFDIGVLEGGGSPAEINLRKCDVVNMGMAEMIDAPVILVGNIEIGGVFASIYGTVALLDEKDKKRIKGYIINKFRGDKNLLQSGIDMLDDRFKNEGLDIKCLGVVPYQKLNIEEEDILAKKINIHNDDNAEINIYVIRTNKMSNYTDFDSLSYFPNVNVRYIFNAGELDNDCDAIILPGSKNTIMDLLKLKENGIFDRVKELYSQGKTVVGICGGFQMMGEKICDPHHIESLNTETRGFGILPLTTTMEEIKCTEQVEIIVPNFYLKKDIKIKGYEIHQGITQDKNGVSYKFMTNKNSFGTYIHGIFDNTQFTENFVNYLRQKKNLKPITSTQTFAEFKEQEYNQLAELLRHNLDMTKIYEILKNS